MTWTLQKLFVKLWVSLELGAITWEEVEILRDDKLHRGKDFILFTAAFP